MPSVCLILLWFKPLFPVSKNLFIVLGALASGIVLGLLVLRFIPQSAEVNTLIASSASPYLRAHSDDPIHWRPLSREAVELARRENKPLLISSGYQSCYWCYRMKMDTFSDDDVARRINEAFIPILIDREINIEADRQLQWIAAQQNGHGGWPLTMIFTPQGFSVIGFNYLDGESFSKALDRFNDVWQSDSQKVVNLAREDTERRDEAYQKQEEILIDIDYPALASGFLRQLNGAADPEYGGFGRGEKFPFVPQLDALLTLYSINPDPALAKFLSLTLDNLLNGALHDHIAGGFFRYADNRDWTSPHYEKMLYTQALLGRHLIRAGGVLGRDDFIAGGVQTLVQMVNEFRDEDGFYISALSAVDSTQKRNRQGGYYLWTESEMADHLGKNWRDHIINLLGENEPLVLPKLIGESAHEHRSRLFEIRNNRAQVVDDKKILAWQGLVLSALSHGATVSTPLALAAESLAEKLLSQVQNKPLTRLIGDEVPPELSDYVYLAQGFVDWWQLQNQPEFLGASEQLLVDAYDHFQEQERWKNPDHFGILAAPGVRAMRDEQLPSPSAIWLSLAWGMGELKQGSTLASQADALSLQLPVALRDESFFHGTTLSTLFARQWHLGKMASVKSSSSQ